MHVWLVSVLRNGKTELLRIFDNEQSALDYWRLSKQEKACGFNNFDECFVNKVPLWN